MARALVVCGLPLAHMVMLVYTMDLIIFKLYCNLIWGASRLGLSPSPGHMHLYVTTILCTEISRGNWYKKVIPGPIVYHITTCARVQISMRFMPTVLCKAM
jgi:hypothetical protein